MKILIIQHKMIGDVLTTSILCEALKERYENCEVHYMINENTSAVVQGNPYIDRPIIYTSEIARNRKLQKKMRRDLKLEKYDVALDVYSKLGSARMVRATQAKKIIGYKKWYTKGFYTHLFRYHYVPKTVAGLAIENRLKLLQALDSEFPNAMKPKIYLRDEEIAFAKAELKKHQLSPDRKLFMIGVLGSSPDKTYPLENFAKVLDHLVEETDAQLLFNYIPNQLSDVERLVSYCSSHTRDAIHLDVYGKNLREFIALASQCDGLIGNEGGAINMAKAVGIPTFAIFSPWIRKEAWALYEDEQNHVVHFKDMEPDVYEKRSLKSIKKEVRKYYKKMSPSFVNEKLTKFLKENGFIHRKTA